MAYFFSMLRFVPDPARGEFINIGAVVGDDDARDWEFRLISNLTRARAIDAQGLLPAALEFAGELEGRLPAAEEDSPSERPAHAWLTVPALRALAGEMNNVVQLTVPAPVVAESAEGALDIVFEELILDPAAKRFRFEKKHRAVRVTRDAYRTSGVPLEAVKERVVVASGQFRSQFDFAVHNGHAVQLVQCWSFQLPNQHELADQVKAWAWTVHELRERGAWVHANGMELEAQAGLEVATMYIPPLSAASASAFNEARAAFAEVDVQEFTPDDAADLGQSAAAALGVAA